MRKVAVSMPKLGYVTSFVQVEMGLKNLSDMWRIFVEASEDGNESYKSKKAICLEFATALSELYDLSEPPFNKMGLKMDTAS
jgi:hypothetical protein